MAAGAGDRAAFEDLQRQLERNASANPKDISSKPMFSWDAINERKEQARSSRARCFNSMAANGSEFEAPKYMRPKVLDPWTAARMMEPSGRRGSQMRFTAKSEPFPEAKDELCHEMHYEWLKKHHVRHRDDSHPVYTARKRVEKAEQILGSHERKRQLTRRLVQESANMELPELSEGVIDKLSKVKQKVAVTQAFSRKSTASLAAAAFEEERDRERLERAKSHPALQTRPLTPKGSAKHRSAWTGNDRTIRHFRESTPWREKDLEIALKARKAQLGTTAPR